MASFQNVCEILIDVRFPDRRINSERRVSFACSLLWGDVMINEYEEMKRVSRMSISGDTKSDAASKETDSRSAAGLTGLTGLADLGWKCEDGVCTLQWKPRKDKEN